MLKAMNVWKTLFQPLGCLGNRNENNILNKQKQLILNQFFKMITFK